jgi:Flp pilus assembly protein TadG
MTKESEPMHRERIMRRLIESESGVTLIMVGLSAFVLMGLSAFVLDFGAMWLARRQAQNAADAGALAGAVARAFDEKANPPSSGGLAVKSATTTALWNRVLGPGSASTAQVSWDCPPHTSAGPTDCVHVDVYRDGTNGSTALPTWFAPILGITSQGVRATATARVLAANRTSCMKPWLIEDKFTGPNGPNGLFDPAVDTYVAPTPTSPGTGYSVQNDLGTHVTFHEDGSVPSFYFDIVLACGTGGACLRDSIANCDPVNQTYTIGDPVTSEPGKKAGPTRQGVDALIAHDPTATWDPVSLKVVNSCAPNCACVPTCGSGLVSPRIVQAGLVSPVEVFYAGGGRYTYHLVNILSFFVAGRSGPQGLDIDAYIVSGPGQIGTGGTVGPGSAFAVTTALIR